MTTLVTGHGLVGSRAVEALRRRGERVVVYDLTPPLTVPGITSVQGDILRLDALTAAVREHRPDRILHTAGLLTPAGRERPHDTVQVNISGTANVLEAARLCAVARVVICSSVVVYDATVPAERIGEDHPTGPRTVYAATKLAAELLGREYARLAGMSVLAVRFAAVYGPASRPGGGVSRVINDALTDAIGTGHARVRRRWPGHQELLYAVDAADALVAAGFAARPRHDVFNIGSGEHVAVEDVGAAVAEMTGASVEIVDAGLEVNPHVVGAPLDLRRARDELGWSPAYDLRRGLAEQTAWLRQARERPTG